MGQGDNDETEDNKGQRGLSTEEAFLRWVGWDSILNHGRGIIKRLLFRLVNVLTEKLEAHKAIVGRYETLFKVLVEGIYVSGVAFLNF